MPPYRLVSCPRSRVSVRGQNLPRKRVFFASSCRDPRYELRSPVPRRRCPRDRYRLGAVRKYCQVPRASLESIIGHGRSLITAANIWQTCHTLRLLNCPDNELLTAFRDRTRWKIYFVAKYFPIISSFGSGLWPRLLVASANYGSCTKIESVSGRNGDDAVDHPAPSSSDITRTW